MVIKCCVPNCKSNYAFSNDKVPVYKLPQNNKDKKKWIAVIPRANFAVSKYTAVYVENTGPKIQHFFLYTANRNQTTNHLLLIAVIFLYLC